MNKSNTFDEFSVLENILTKDPKKKSPGIQSVVEGADCSDVEVPAEFYTLITGSKPKTARSAKEIIEEQTKEEEVVEEEEVAIEPDSTLLTESTGQELVSLLSEVKNLLSEMCGTGSIGVNMGGPAPDPMKKEEGEKKRSGRDRIKRLRRKKRS